MGTLNLPFDMYRIFAAWLTSSSMHSKRKSEYCRSGIGRIPISAAPTAAPAIAFSLIGVSMMRSWPNSSVRPR